MDQAVGGEMSSNPPTAWTKCPRQGFREVLETGRRCAATPNLLRKDRNMISLANSRDTAQFLETLQLVLVGEQEVFIDGLVCVPDIRIAEMFVNGAPDPADSDESWWTIRTPEGRTVYVAEMGVAA